MRIPLTIVLFLHIAFTRAQDHPNLILTREGVSDMRASIGSIPLFDQSMVSVRQQVDAALDTEMDVPVPRDLAGGYTHEQHKSNFFLMQKAGVLFQITQEEKYATYIRDMLLAYANLYPTLGKHPATRSYARGKFFWQCLNDANWLVYTSQAYDCIYDWLDSSTRKKLNEELFRPYAEYISIENPQFFNRIHNHSTWGNAAVGMIGLVMGDEELVQWALYGLDTRVPGDILKDNDGGAIQLEGQEEAGFLAQLDHAFSPDGYYTEGPYYQRYAMYPFLIFAQGLANRKPELDILNYRDGLLIKAVYALINQTNSAGEFFPINDAQKGMSLASRELVNAVSMAYYYGNKDVQLLSLIEQQDRVPLNDSGLAAARSIADGDAVPYDFQSLELSDGPDGDQGGIGILRNQGLTLMMKYARHGMGHGHFDRLSFLFYNQDEEVIQDYGAARWVNIEHKDGGGYLKENKTWAKQTIAHNTLVINRRSQHDGAVKRADQTFGEPYFFDAEYEEVQVMSAKEIHGYENVKMHRTMALIDLEELENPLVLDLFKVQSEIKNDYLLPFYYKGELMRSSSAFEIKTDLSPAGASNGFQHLWIEAKGPVRAKTYAMTWFDAGKFYTLTSASSEEDEFLLGRIGANDPNFNLRRDPVLILSRPKTASTLFVQAIETHGTYRPADEIPINAFSSIREVKVLHNSDDYSVVQLQLTSMETYQFAFANMDKRKTSVHRVSIGGQDMEWQGVYDFKKMN